MPDAIDADPSQPLEAPVARPAKRKARREFCIPKASFRRLVQEVASEFKSDMRFQQEALDALQESTENLVVERFHRCSELAELCKLDTVREEHWRFVREVPCSGTS